MTLSELLEYAFLTGGFTTRSDTAREHAEVIAQAGQLSLLTTETPRDGFGNVWRLTPYGFEVMWRGSLECQCDECATLLHSEIVPAEGGDTLH